MGLLALSSTTANAQDTSATVGVSLMSEYVSQGLQQSDGHALELYYDLSYGGYYAGVYIINTERDLTLDDFESGFYLGYAGSVGSFFYDASLHYYMFDAPFAQFGPVFVVEFEQLDLSVSVDYYTNLDGLALYATYGTVDTEFGDWDYWSAGGSYAVTDSISLAESYHDSDASPAIGSSADGMIVGSLSWAFSLR